MNIPQTYDDWKTDHPEYYDDKPERPERDPDQMREDEQDDEMSGIKRGNHHDD